MAPDKARRRELKVAAAPRRPVSIPAFHRGPRYRVAHACFACRKSFKIAWDPTSDKAASTPHPCPDCQAPLRWMGRTFKAPARRDVDQWKKVELLCDAGFRFGSYGRPEGAEALPATLAEVPAFLQRNAGKT